MAALDLATRDDVTAVLDELRQLRLEVERLKGHQPGELLTLPQAAGRLGKSLRTVERWVQRGQLHAVQIGAARYVRLPDAPARE